jgi:hypothetical protein
LLLSLFFFQWNAWNGAVLPKCTVSFKQKLAPKRVIFQINPSICTPFHFGNWFWISSIRSLIGHQTSIVMQLSPRFDQINSKKL